jgi:hypothetical protein
LTAVVDGSLVALFGSLAIPSSPIYDPDQLTGSLNGFIWGNDE